MDYNAAYAEGLRGRFVVAPDMPGHGDAVEEDDAELSFVAFADRVVALLDAMDLPRVDLPTETGDVTVHCSCTLHMARPPSERERMVVYTGFGLPPRPGERAPAPDVERLERERADISRQARELQRGRA